MAKLKELFTVKDNGPKDKITGLIVLFLYTAGIIFITSFHELWFDETQAWQIAKSASYKEIFTYIPHYEGHPPLWHLILSVFAKNGAPVEFTLKAINTVFCVIAMAILIFRSPFPKIVKYLLPFTFFFFYQYGVLSRPYSLAMIVFFLLAITYKDRNRHPWRYILVMTLLCLVSAFGIMLAGGLCIVWTFEIITELIRNKKLKFFWKDMRFYSLCFILVTAVVLICMIIPAEDCYYIGVDDGLSLLERMTNLVYYEYLAALPFESWSGVLMESYGIRDLPPLEVAEVICGLMMWTGLIAFTVKNKKFFTFFLPYIFMTVFMSFKYVSLHHLGIVAIFPIFIFWIILEEKGRIEVPGFIKKINEKLTSPLIRKFIIGAGGLICIAPVIYSVIASVNEIRYNVGLTCVAKTIKENHLEDSKIMVMWDIIYETKDEEDKDEEDKDEDEDDKEFDSYIFKVLQIPSAHEKIKEHRTYLMGAAAMIAPYFDENIIMNFNVDKPSDMYMHYQYKEDYEKVFDSWREKGLPDFIVGYCPIDEIYDEKELEGVRYLPIQLIESCTVNKIDVDKGTTYFYMREDLFDDYPQFKWINDQTENVFERKPSKDSEE